MNKGILCFIIMIGLVVLAKNATDIINYHLYISMAIVSGAVAYNTMGANKNATN